MVVTAAVSGVATAAVTRGVNAAGAGVIDYVVVHNVLRVGTMVAPQLGASPNFHPFLLAAAAATAASDPPFIRQRIIVRVAAATAATAAAASTAAAAVSVVILVIFVLDIVFGTKTTPPIIKC